MNSQTAHPIRVQADTQDKTPWVRILWRYLSQKVADKTPSQALPVQQPDLSGKDNLVIRLSHSTVLLRLDGQYLLLDPVFSERASPLSFAGPKRFHPLPMQISDLPEMSAVLISHDHYDHLDKKSVQQLDAKSRCFIVPPGVDQHLIRFGIAADKIRVLDWWEQTQLGSLTIHATPAQHFSGRGFWDKNQTCWASFVVESSQQRIFYSGDSGYFNGFAQIGRRFGPIDLALIETGAYDELWPDVHMQPEQSLRAHLDLQARYLMPVHNSSFDLAMHAWYEPLERLALAAEAYQVPLVTPVFGAAVKLAQLGQPQQPNLYWWRELMPSGATLSLEPLFIPA
ncbi:MBL fold metallo-hydrolase [Rheinheimera sp.]|uniref:MBL fold metallo-hydrolase n=1 Tax=Rheinheimera sp. TaxID=1869214 RepID=UPI00307DD213